MSDQTVGNAGDGQVDKAAFLALIAPAVADGSFVRVSLGKYRGGGDEEKTIVTRVDLKGVPHLKFVRSAGRKETTENFSVDAGVARLGAVLGQSYLSATLFTTARDATLTYSKKRVARLSSGKPTFSDVPSAEHNRAKAYLVPSSRPFLLSIGITDDQARIKPSMFAKFKQIERFIEIVDGLVAQSSLGQRGEIRILDIGAGKGYLTFALYDHLVSTAGKACSVVGVEVREDLVRDGNARAGALGFSGLSFEQAAAGTLAGRGADVVIALHACDTATDDAIALGVQAGAELIVTSPCCQHELAPQMDRPDKGLNGLIKFSLLRRRQADLVTDAARALLMEAAGYKVAVIEFVSTEHTAKNIMLAGVKSGSVDRALAMEQYRALKISAGFQTHHLERLLQGTSA